MSYYLQTGNAIYPQHTMVVPDEDSSGLYRQKFNWSYRQRSAYQQEGYFFPNWSLSYGAEDDFTGTQGLLRSNSWEPWSDAVGGMTRHYFINGRTFNANGDPIASTVQAYLTANNLYVGKIGTDSGGNYSLPTIYTTNAHFLIAYTSPSADLVGGTVNTIIPDITPG